MQTATPQASTAQSAAENTAAPRAGPDAAGPAPAGAARTAVILVAAGRGTRAGGGLPKQWRPLAGARVLDHALAAFRGLPGIGPVVVVLHPDDIAAQAPALQAAGASVVAGGASRNDSVRAGLESLGATAPDLVLIHDGARPCVSAALIGRVIAALDRHAGAAPALAVVDALWRGDGGLVVGTQDRSGLYRAQTPQGFRFADILAAHRAHCGEAADDVEVARAAGLEVAIVPGCEDNLKLTWPDDFARAEAILRRG